MKNLYVVTHAQSLHHVQSRVGGWYDTSLTELGVRQAEATAYRLRELVSSSRPEIVSSDLKRASETASIICDAFGASMRLDPGFRENSYGCAEGRPQEWLNKRILTAPDHDRLDHLVIEGAESKRTFVDRIYNSMKELPDTEHTILVTHGYALTFVIAYWIGMPLESTGYVNFSTKPCSITHLQHGGLFNNRVVSFVSDTSHLPVEH